ncbi:kinase-like protein [Suhomyces tanzawaensis NRRL Y-17324]|uniref:non-specific serine/threonine protein kinase n=1 Tax=Suhomyces tanzawaensis NRRL Y-17324 TaxID=984487 RepID=A0A1E4SCZ5_9ASCO|nr:kinase-like protein [Suhomyces tanzawaensis NRRL Y-17324]ODV77262.1 kinase-like protein [Suhomyces tanzawaensis NRRL Y-17324]
MEIPLKSQPKVSTVNLVDESKFQFDDASNISSQYPRVREVPNRSLGGESPGKNYRLTRTYSETEKSNFDEETGHRLYDDGRIRPQLSRSGSSRDPLDTHYSIGKSNTPKLYSRSHNEYIDAGDEYLKGLEDEYIPGLDFGDVLHRWNNSLSEQSLAGANNNYESAVSSTSSTASNTPLSRDQSYLDLKTLHAKVAPQPIRLRNHLSNNKHSFSKLHDFMKLRTPSNNSNPGVMGKADGSKQTLVNDDRNNSTTTLTSSERSKDDANDSGSHKNKKQKSEENSVDYEWIINSLPSYFEDLPYSQRKKLVASLSESVDYSQFSVYAKNYFNDKMAGAGRTPRSGGIGSNSGSLRRSRRSSVNTVAGRLLALSSSTDLKKLEEAKPKVNVDEKGAMVMEHELGKVIGFGAWGTIRECTDRHGTVRAMKIVKSCKDFESRSSSPGRSGTPPKSDMTHNPKVLQVFKKEIMIWKQLQHPNILPLLKHLETDHAIFCITNRIYGGTLFELVSSWGLFNAGIMNTSGPIEFLIESQTERLTHIVKATKQIVKALLYMHEEKGIVHGDLKLENVLVEDGDKGEYKMILADFGMSRVFNSRVSRNSSLRRIPSLNDDEDDGTLMMRSKSSTTDLRRPYNGGDTPSTRNLNWGFNDDSKIGISNFMRPHGPSLQSVDLTPVQSASTGSIMEFKRKSKASPNSQDGIDSDLPHSHIGSLPYASPELLSPSPPPLGPLADVWALGILMFTMCVGKLPFQQQYEPRLRAMISAGKYNKRDLRKSCLLEWIYREDDEDDEDKLPEGMMINSPSMVDLKRQEELSQLHQSWKQLMAENKKRGSPERPDFQFEFLYDIIVGCLELNITKRWDLEMIHDSLEACDLFHKK